MPPMLPCCEIRCGQNVELLTCKHKMKELLELAGVRTCVEVKAEKIKWHPDKFAVCRLEKRCEFQRKAQELFKILGMVQDDMERRR